MSQTPSTPAAVEGLPPGLRWPRVAQTILWGVVPTAFFRHCQRRHGDIFVVRTLVIGDVVVLADPPVIKDVFAADRDVFCAGQANAIMGTLLGKHSLFLLDGERHLSQRRMMLPPFHGEAIRGYEQLIEEITTTELERWPVGKELAIRPRMQTIALEAILRAVIGVRDHRRLERLRYLLPRLLNLSLLTMWVLWSRPTLADSWPVRHLTAWRHRAEVDRLLYEEIAAHRADPTGRNDILASLIAARDEHGQSLSDDELRDQIITLLLAGNETTATALAWCFERLLRHPDCMQRLRNELSQEDDGPYLKAVVEETLRVRPVLDAVWRQLTAPAEIAGYSLPAGIKVMPSIALVHAGESFPAAEEFRPERLLNGTPAPYTMIPFGGGPRRCIGASFALMEIKTILRVVLESLELRADRPRAERTRVRNIMLVPARGARAIVDSKRATGRATAGALETVERALPAQ